MELALITAQQVAVLFLLIGTGMVAVKTGVLKLENKQALSNLLVYIIVPGHGGKLLPHGVQHPDPA